MGARPYEAGRASEIVAHWCDFKAGIPSTNSVKPTQPVSVSKVRPRASRSSSQGEGRRATDKSQRAGPQTGRLEGKGLDLRGHHLCGGRNSQGTNPRTVAGERVSSPAEAMMQASVVAGIMACCNELGLRGRSSFRAPRVVTSNLKKLNERFRVCEEQTRTCSTAQRPECQQARAPRNPAMPRLFFSRPRASRSSSRGRGVGLVFLWCAPSSSSLFCRFSVLVSRELSRSRGGAQ